MTFDDLGERIYTAVGSVTPDMLVRMWEELEYCLDVCKYALIKVY